MVVCFSTIQTQARPGRGRLGEWCYSTPLLRGFVFLHEGRFFWYGAWSLCVWFQTATGITSHTPHRTRAIRTQRPVTGKVRRVLEEVRFDTKEVVRGGGTNGSTPTYRTTYQRTGIFSLFLGLATARRLSCRPDGQRVASLKFFVTKNEKHRCHGATVGDQ